MLRGSGPTTRVGAGVAFGGTLQSVAPRIGTSAGPVINVATASELTSQLGSCANGSVLRLTANIDGAGAVLPLTRVAAAGAPITITSVAGVTISNFSQVNVTGAYLRLLDLEIAQATSFAVKFDVGGHHNEMDGCTIRNSTSSGILVGLDSANNHQIWNCKIHNCGSDTNQDHGIYFDQTGGVQGCVVANCLIYDCQAYGIQAYPHATDLIITCCTIDGGVTRGGIVVGSENGTTDDVVVVGAIVTNAPWYAIQPYDPVSGCTGSAGYDCLGFGNTLGDFNADPSFTYTNCVHGDPLYTNRVAKDFTLQPGSPAKGLISASRYGYVPATDINGVARTVTNVAAGAYAA